MDKSIAFGVARKLGWLADMPEELQSEILARCDLVMFAAQDAIYNAGDEPGGLIGVVEGAIWLHLPLPDGEHGLGYIGGPGFWTGDVAAITGRPRHIAVSAASACAVLRLPRASLGAIAERQPLVWRHLAGLVSRNLLLAMDIIGALKRNDPVKRIAATILNLLSSDSLGSSILEVSQSDLAIVANLSRGRANSAIAALERYGWVSRGYGTLEVTNANALSAFVNGS
jgi:CRP/FNR family transcriptional regulator, cyclic AMP receptor protein